MDLPSEIVALIIGATGSMALLWVKDKIDAALSKTDAVADEVKGARVREDEAADDWHDFAKSIAESMASVATTIKHHGDRIDGLERGATVARDGAADMQRALALGAEQARVASLEISDIKSIVRALTETSIRMGTLLEAHDRRTAEFGSKLDAMTTTRNASDDKIEALYRLIERAVRPPVAA